MIETEDDLRDLFDTEDGFAVIARVTGPDDFDLSLPVIVNDGTQAVDVYGDTNVEASQVDFLAMDVDIVGVQTGMAVSFPQVDSADPVHRRLIGKTFIVKRIAAAEPGTSTIFLKE